MLVCARSTASSCVGSASAFVVTPQIRGGRPRVLSSRRADEAWVGIFPALAAKPLVSGCKYTLHAAAEAATLRHEPNGSSGRRLTRCGEAVTILQGAQ